MVRFQNKLLIKDWGNRIMGHNEFRFDYMDKVIVTNDYLTNYKKYKRPLGTPAPSLYLRPVHCRYLVALRLHSSLR